MQFGTSRRLLTLAVAVGLVGATASIAGPSRPAQPRDAALDDPVRTRVWPISYHAHTGRIRWAYVLLPSWYGPTRNPPIPLVISPHGRGTDGRANLRLWGDLPGLGGFAVVNPDGEGNRLGEHSWGAPGQIDDLARMPAIVRRALPWLRLAPKKVFALGGSMGGQETLLLLAKHPRLLAGAAAFDSVADFAHQYRQFPRLRCSAACRARLGSSLGAVLQGLARTEIGGSPEHVPAAYASRSPLTYVRALAESCVPLQLWWSRRDRIVVDAHRQSARLLAAIRRLNPAAPVLGIDGTWAHSAEMRASTRLPFALARLGLLPPRFDGRWGTAGARVVEPSGPACGRV